MRKNERNSRKAIYQFVRTFAQGARLNLDTSSHRVVLDHYSSLCTEVISPLLMPMSGYTSFTRLWLSLIECWLDLIGLCVDVE